MGKNLNVNFGKRNLRSKCMVLITWLLTLCLLMYSPLGALVVASESNEGITQNTLEEPFFQSQSTTPSAITVTTPSAIAVKNYVKGISDRVEVPGLSPGDIIKVYDQETEGKLLGQGTVVPGETSVTIEIPQLGPEKGTVYISVTSGGTESDRVEVDYVSEPIPWQIYGHTGHWGEDYKLKQGDKFPNPPDPPVYPYSEDNNSNVKLNQHIFIRGMGDRITFYGYGEPGYSDFVFLPSDETAAKTITFSMDLDKVDYHSMEGAGILFNSKIEVGVDGKEKLNGYILLFITGKQIQLYKATNVDVQDLRETSKSSNKGITQIKGITKGGTAYNADNSNLHIIKLEVSPGNIKLEDNNGVRINLNNLEPVGNGVGFIASHVSHSCPQLSYFTITNVKITDTIDSTYTWPLLDLTAQPSSENPYSSVDLNYTAPEKAEVVILQYSTDPTFPEGSTVSIPIDSESAQTTVNGLNGNTKYYFRLLIGGGSNGGISNIADATTQKNTNKAPTATSVSITGKHEVGQTLIGNYKYTDAEGDNEKKGEGGTTFKWYRGTKQDGSDKQPIAGATSQTYTLGVEDNGKYIFFEVTPIAESGNTTGNPTRSVPVGPVTLPSSMNLDGIVTDRDDAGKKIADATVILKDLSGKEIARTKTDQNGKYLFSQVALGKYKIVVENPQYSTKTTDVDVMPHSSNGTVSVDASGNLTLTKDVKLVNFIITLVADPSTIVGDGKTTTTLHARITDKDNKPIPGITVNFSALDGKASIGDFPGPAGAKAITDQDGKCSVVYQSANLAGIESKTVVVRAEVNDDKKGLHAISEILVTFEPSSIQGVVLDNATGKPVAVAGAIVEVAEDFDGDGIVDFYAKTITGGDGKYKIAVPKGNMDYHVNITKPVVVDGISTGEVTFTHTCNVGNITGAAIERFDSSKTITGVALQKALDGSTQRLSGSSYEVELVDSDQNPVTTGALTDKGIFKADNLSPGTYTINLKHDVGATGQKLTIGKAVATVNADGEIVISTILIDPYGTVTDRDTGLPISGVNMKLYWANTDLNKKAGRTPGTLVNLPADPAATNNNANPQPTSNTGYYAWMVIPNGDYYIIAEKSGYYTYDSRQDKRSETIGDSWIKDGTIHVGTDIVLYDLQMEPRDEDRGGGGSAPVGPVTPPAENTSIIVNPQNPMLVVPADELTKKDILTGALNRYNEQEKTNAQRENRTPKLIDVSNLNASTYEFSSSNSSIADFDTSGILNIYGRGPFVIRISKKGTNNVYEYQMVASQGLQRIAGATRIDTALAIAKGSYFGKVKSVVVARADDFPDALTGSVLAYKKEAPVLLVGRSEEDCRKLVEYLKGYLEPQGNVYILGGTGAVSQYVEDSVKNNGFSNVIRLGGADRYGTAAKIAVELDIAQGRPVVIASGQSFPDALSVSSIAAAEQFPLLIVKPNSVPDEVKEKLIQLKPSIIYIIGLQGAVSDKVKDEVAQLTGLGQDKVVRIGGQDRYASTLAVAQFFNPSGRGISIATGRDFPDALAGSVYSAKLKDPLILVEEILSVDLKDYLRVRKPSDIVIFGGQGAVSPAIEEELKSMVK